MNVNQETPIILMCVFAFLFGSIPFGVLVARFYQKDITQLGSGNIGATNVTRVLGFWPAGAMTFFLDFLKGVIPVLLVQAAVAPFWLRWISMSDYEFTLPSVWAVGFLAVAGHCFSPWLRFRGGKGVATGFGVIVMLSPWAALAGVLAFIITFLNRRIGSVSSLSGLTVAGIAHLILHPAGSYIVFGAALVFLIVLRHEANLDALLDQREKTF